MIYYIGIDPSMNSTGVCIQKYDNDIKLKEEFIVIKPSNENKSEDKWLTKKEKIANEAFLNFEYIFYDKIDISKYKENNHLSEYYKTYNMINLVCTIKNIIKEYTKDNPEKLYILIEGISYGSSMRTKSIFDLAGLNYLIREKFVEKSDISFVIATPSEIKKFASGNGNCNKEVMINLFMVSHPSFNIIPKVDDISDAWFMSNYVRYLTNNMT